MFGQRSLERALVRRHGAGRVSYVTPSVDAYDTARARQFRKLARNIRAKVREAGGVIPRRLPAVSDRGPLVRGRVALMWAFLMNFGQRGTAAIVTFVLAGIVGPRDYGLIAIAMIYIALFELCLGQGVGVALVQRDDLTEEDLDSAFWMNVAWASVLTAVGIVSARWWALATSQPDLEPVIQVLSLLIPIHALTIVQSSVLQRRMRFKQMAIRSGVANLVGGAAGLTLAILGFGIWALVTHLLATAIASLVLLWSITEWLPSFRFSWARARGLLRFSSQVFVGNLGVFVGRRSDALLIGLFFGPVAVGLYRLADRMVEAVVSVTTRPVQQFALPYFSRLQNDPEGLARGVRKCMRLTLMTNIPSLLVLFACSEYVMRAFGPEWTSAGNALKLLSLVGIAKAVVLVAGPLLYAVGKPFVRTVLAWVFGALSAASFIAVAFFLDGRSVEDQVTGIALSRTVVFVGFFLPACLLIVASIARVQWTTLLPGLRASLVAGVSAVAAIAALGASGLLDAGPALLALVESTLAAALVAVAVLLALDRELRDQLRELLRRFGRTAPASDPSLTEPA